MRYITAAAVGAVMSAGAAQAAVYQYDVTMEISSLYLNYATFDGDGEVPEISREASCSVGTSYKCPTSINVLDASLGNSLPPRV